MSIFPSSLPPVQIDTHRHFATPIKPRSATITREILAPQPGRAAVLIVTNNVRVSNLIARMLQAKGYRTLEAVGIEEALQYSEQNRGMVDLLVADIDPLPKELIKRIQQQLPNQKVLYLCEYSEEQTASEFPLGVAILQKPFSLASLITKVQAALKCDRPVIVSHADSALSPRPAPIAISNSEPAAQANAALALTLAGFSMVLGVCFGIATLVGAQGLEPRTPSV